MFQFQGIWLPDGEKHFPDWMKRNGELVDGRGTYQIKKYRAAMQWVKRTRVAVDVGGHVGLWAMQMFKRFAVTHAFEPVAAFRECFIKNTAPTFANAREQWTNRIYLYEFALGAAAGEVRIDYRPEDSGGTHVAKDGTIVAEMRTLDSFGFADVDFLKLDCEGYELEALKGAAETLARCKPCVIVEQKPHKLGPNFGITGTPAVDYLKAMGAVLRREIGGDYILSW